MNEINGYIIRFDAINCVYLIMEDGLTITTEETEEGAINFCKL